MGGNVLVWESQEAWAQILSRYVTLEKWPSYLKAQFPQQLNQLIQYYFLPYRLDEQIPAKCQVHPRCTGNAGHIIFTGVTI